MLSVQSPVTGEVIAETGESSVADVDAAVQAARRATRRLRDLTVWQRAELLHGTADLLSARRAEAIEEHVLEHGKTRAHAEAEFDAAVGGLRIHAELAKHLEGRITPTADVRMKVLTEREPLGVVAAITPWNVPFMVPVEYGAPALAMGNAFVWKPAESVPLTSRHVQQAFEEAGWPEGSVEMVEGGPVTGSALAHHPDVAALCFTGSSNVGSEIAAIGGMRKLILELGGNGPTIVFADADVEQAAERIVSGTCFLSGQSCAATERVLVEQPVEAELLEALVERVRSERVGDPRDPDSTFGPIHLDETSRTIERHLSDAGARGARVLAGGRRDPAPTDRYWQPTIVADVTPEMELFREETFGPVIPVTRFSGEAEALDLAARDGYGLCSAVFTHDVDRAFRVARLLPASFVVVNHTSNYWEMQLPWGGGPGSASGVGRLGGRHALFELSTTKSVVIALGWADVPSADRRR